MALLVALGGTRVSAVSPGPAEPLRPTGICPRLKSALTAGRLILASSAHANDLNLRGTVSAGPCGGGAEGSVCPAGNDANHVRVFTDNPGETATEDHSFYVAVVG